MQRTVNIVQTYQMFIHFILLLRRITSRNPCQIFLKIDKRRRKRCVIEFDEKIFFSLLGFLWNWCVWESIFLNLRHCFVGFFFLFVHKRLSAAIGNLAFLWRRWIRFILHDPDRLRRIPCGVIFDREGHGGKRAFTYQQTELTLLTFFQRLW